MSSPDMLVPGESRASTGVHQVGYLMAPFSHVWLPRLVEIDASWNPCPWSEDHFEHELGNPSARIRGLFKGGELVGYAVARIVCNEAHLLSLGIAPEHRGEGLGEALLRDLLKALTREGIEMVTLEVRISNSVAQGLYQKVGFEIVALHKRFYSSDNEDAIMMRLAFMER